MKKIRNRNLRPTLYAVVFFGIMALIGAGTANAQADSTNVLFLTSGPGVLGSGRLMAGFSAQWDCTEVLGGGGRYNYYGADAGLRWGIGGKAELTLGLGWYTASIAYPTVTSSAKDVLFDTVDRYYIRNLQPSIGARLNLYEGRGWLPQVTFNTKITVPFTLSTNFCNPDSLSPYGHAMMSLQFRNIIGKRWAIDYSAGVWWHQTTGIYGVNRAEWEPEFTIFGRWLATDRLMLGVGYRHEWESHRSAMEVTWQDTPELQLKAEASFGMGMRAVNDGMLDIHTLVGLNWMLK